ncbi:AraC family transcriptional regulator [Cesiribacter sp. SM1]|uniref:AraC family transcriptional regulator n=1 Tax=Cesiribacter sp. SM1 TaxID=2861196 RepID=UPI001CD55E84|nr:AraC family transcriptional regulator [Cesiribacter sp. SM1]
MLSAAANIGLVKDIVYGMCQTEAEIAAFWRMVGLKQEELSNPNAVVGVQMLEKIFSHASECTAAASVGLLAGRKASLSSWGAVGQLMQICPDLRTALEVLCKYHSSFTKSIYFDLFAEGELVVLQITPEQGWQDQWQVSCRNSVEYMLSATLHFLESLAKHPVIPAKVTFSYYPPQAHTLEQAFKAPLAFGQVGNRLYFHKKELQHSISGYNLNFYKYLEQFLEEALAVHTTDLQLSEQVCKLIKCRLSTGKPVSIQLIALDAAMSLRSLQRKLELEGVTFQQLLDGVKKEEALCLLRSNRYSITEISDKLGYSEAAAFRKAFRKWTGESPRSYKPLLLAR